MRALFIVAVMAAVSGCASTGVVQSSGDTFFIAKKSAAGVFGTPDGVRADIYQEANNFCSERGKKMELVDQEINGAIPFVRTGSAAITFRCSP